MIIPADKDAISIFERIFGVKYVSMGWLYDILMIIYIFFYLDCTSVQPDSCVWATYIYSFCLKHVITNKDDLALWLTVDRDLPNDNTEYGNGLKVNHK